MSTLFLPLLCVLQKHTEKMVVQQISCSMLGGQVIIIIIIIIFIIIFVIIIIVPKHNEKMDQQISYSMLGGQVAPS